MQGQKCAFMCLEGAVGQRVRLGSAVPLAPRWLSWPRGISQPLHAPHTDAWILLPPSGDFQYGTAVTGGFHINAAFITNL